MDRRTYRILTCKEGDKLLIPVDTPEVETWEEIIRDERIHIGRGIVMQVMLGDHEDELKRLNIAENDVLFYHLRQEEAVNKDKFTVTSYIGRRTGDEKTGSNI